MKDIEDVKSVAKDVLKILDTTGMKILEKDPDIYVKMIQQATYLIESEDYLSIIEVQMYTFSCVFSCTFIK